MSDPPSQGEPGALARRAADALWAGDGASQGLGMEILEVGPGLAVLAMTIQDSMTNGHGTAHGGYIFTLADSAFAFACNSYGEPAVAAHCAITYLRPGKPGDRLIATACEIARSGRTGIYDVRVACGDQTIAEFRGHSRIVGGSVMKGDSAA
jgi:acyl-CoA thioesterase